MAKADVERVLSALESGISEVLIPKGFVRQPDSVSRGEVFRRWERRVPWRIDGFDMVSHAAGFPGPELQIGVRIPLPDGDFVRVDGGPVPWLLRGSTDPLIEYSAVEREPTSSAKEARIRDAITECARTLTWFDAFATPAKCLEQLARRDRNGARVGSPLHNQALAIVQSASV